MRVPSVACLASRVSAMNWPILAKETSKNYVGFRPLIYYVYETKTNKKKEKQCPAVSSYNLSDKSGPKKNKILLFTQTARLIKDHTLCFNAVSRSTGPNAEPVTGQTTVTTATQSDLTSPANLKWIKLLFPGFSKMVLRH